MLPVKHLPLKDQATELGWQRQGSSASLFLRGRTYFAASERPSMQLTTWQLRDLSPFRAQAWSLIHSFIQKNQYRNMPSIKKSCNYVRRRSSSR